MKVVTWTPLLMVAVGAALTVVFSDGVTDGGDDIDGKGGAPDWGLGLTVGVWEWWL